MTHRVAYLTILLVAVSVNAYAQTQTHNVNVTIKPSQTVEERVADSIKEKELREAAEEKRAAEKSAEIASKSPRTLLSAAKTIYVTSGTSYFDSVQLENETVYYIDPPPSRLVELIEKGYFTRTTLRKIR